MKVILKLKRRFNRNFKKFTKRISYIWSLKNLYSLFESEIKDGMARGLHRVELATATKNNFLYYFLCRKAVHKLRKKGYTIETEYLRYFRIKRKTWCAII